MNPTVASIIRAPSSASTDPARHPQHISNTGTTEAGNTLPLPLNHYATLLVGDTPVRVAFYPTNSGSVGASNILLAANREFTWTVDANTRHVRMEAADGSSAYEAWVWMSSV